MEKRIAMKTIILTGGGTGGHVIPCLALVPELKKHFDCIHFIGGNGIEKKIVSSYGIPFHTVSTAKLDRQKLLRNVALPFSLCKGTAEAKKILDMLQPAVVFAKGGYASVPACFAARLKKIPIVCHESDYTMGLANKIVSSFAAKTLTSFPETAGGEFVGNPIREEIFRADSPSASTKKTSVKKTVLFFGGSQGAKPINDIVYQSLDALLNEYDIIHIAGQNGDFSVCADGYTQMSYTDDMPRYLSLADIVVCRGGANTLFETAALGKKTVCIPLPKGASRGDQVLNAESFEKQGLVTVLKQDNLTQENLMTALREAKAPSGAKKEMRDVNKNIVEKILSVCK